MINWHYPVSKWTSILLKHLWQHNTCQYIMKTRWEMMSMKIFMGKRKLKVWIIKTFTGESSQGVKHITMEKILAIQLWIWRLHNRIWCFWKLLSNSSNNNSHQHMVNNSHCMLEKKIRTMRSRTSICFRILFFRRGQSVRSQARPPICSIVKNSSSQCKQSHWAPLSTLSRRIYSNNQVDNSFKVIKAMLTARIKKEIVLHLLHSNIKVVMLGRKQRIGSKLLK